MSSFVGEDSLKCEGGNFSLFEKDLLNAKEDGAGSMLSFGHVYGIRFSIFVIEKGPGLTRGLHAHPPCYRLRLDDGKDGGGGC